MIDEPEHPYLGAEFGRRYVDSSTATNAQQAGEIRESNLAYLEQKQGVVLPMAISERDKLKGLIVDANKLIERYVDASDPEFYAWKDRCLRFLAHQYGTKSFQFLRFKQLHFSLMCYGSGTPKSAWNDACVKALKKAKAVLEVYLKEMDESVSNDEIGNQSENCMHPVVWKLAVKAIGADLYADAVERAFKEINSRVKKLVKGRVPIDADGVGLMQKVFSPEKPLIRLADDLDTSGEDVQRGYMFMFAGGMSAIRNPKAHDNIEISKDDALRKLYFASMLMYKLDEAEQQGWIVAGRASK